MRPQLYLVYHDFSFHIQSSQPVLNLRIGQYFRNTLYICTYIDRWSVVRYINVRLGIKTDATIFVMFGFWLSGQANYTGCLKKLGFLKILIIEN